LAIEGTANRIAAVAHASDEGLALLQEEWRTKSANVDGKLNRESGDGQKVET